MRVGKPMSRRMIRTIAADLSEVAVIAPVAMPAIPRRAAERSPGLLLYSAACTALTFARRAAMPTRHRRSLKLTIPPSAMNTAPIQIQGTSGFQ